MKSFFKYKLDANEYENIRKFCSSVDYCSIEQQLDWTNLFYKSTSCYFYLQDDSGIRGYCQMHEKIGAAQIIFGPVCCDKDLMVYSINEIIAYYKRRHFFYLGIQMYYKSGNDTEYIEYKLSNLHKIHYQCDTENTKSSIEINLLESEEKIHSKIRKGHKSDIKKAVKMGCAVDLARDEIDLNSFIEVYSKMCRARRISEDKLSVGNIRDIHNFLDKNKLGEILIVRDESGKVLGGAIFVFQGLTVRYYKGATDPDRRDLPILHLVIFEAIKRAKSNGFTYFDFWGYNHFAYEGEQVFNINHFKKGFGGYFTFFAKKMNIDLIPWGYALYRLLYSFITLIRSKSN